MTLIEPRQASCRIQRWALTLAAYEYILSFCSSAQHRNADTLSRLPLWHARGTGTVGRTSWRFTCVILADQGVDQERSPAGMSLKTPQWGLARPLQWGSSDAILAPAGRTITAWWLPFVGRSCNHTSSWPRIYPQGISWWSSRCLTHENLSTDVCVVAKHGSRHRVNCTALVALAWLYSRFVTTFES